MGALAAICFGACTGSLVKLILDRFCSGETWITGRSRCDFCHRILKWYQLIPVFSYLIQGGKCSACGRRLSCSYPLSEAACALLALLCRLADDETGFCVFAIVILLYIIAYFDLKTMLIETIWLLLLAIPISILVLKKSDLISVCMGFFSLSGLMFLINRIIKDSFGGGDIRLSAICGALLGIKGIFSAWLIANISAGITAALLIMMKKANSGSHIPYAPHLCAAIVFVMFRSMVL